MTDIMMDLETFGAGSHALIVAIGAVKFDLAKKEVYNTQAGGTFYAVINAKSAQAAGGKIDADTVIWWMKQSDAARNAIINAESKPIEEVLTDFTQWIKSANATGIWGNGADFDNVILSNAYQRLGMPVPWTPWISRCYRTLKNLPNNKKVSINRASGTHHNALDDAIAQANHACQLF